MANNTIFSPAIDLLCNPYVQSNVGLRNNIQKTLVGIPFVTKDGNSITEARKKYFNTPSSCSCGTIDRINQRFYNNKLKAPSTINLCGEDNNSKPNASRINLV